MSAGQMGTDTIFIDRNKLEKSALEWGRGTRSALALEIARLGLKDRNKLVNSIRVRLRRRFGEVESVQFSYLYYGLFHDVGAKNAFDKGVNLPGLHWKALGINPRIGQLADIVGEFYAETAVRNVGFGT